MDKLQEVLDAVTKGRELAEGQKAFTETQFNEIKAKIDEQDVRLKEAEKLMMPRQVSLPGVDEGKDKFSFGKAIYGIVSRDWTVSGFEKEVFDQSRKKALETGLGSAGGYIVPTQLVTELIEMLRAKSVAFRMGATPLDNLTAGTVEMPKLTTASTAFSVGENAAITASDLAFGLLTLTPKTVGALVKMSSKAATLSNPAMEGVVRRDIVRTLANKIDILALRGSGVSNEPTGIVNTANIKTVAIGTNGGDFTFSVAEDMVAELEAADALDGKLGFVMHPKAKKKMKKERIAQFSGDTGGAYVILPMNDQNLKDSLGYDFATSTQLPTNLTKGSGTNLSEVIFANWEELMIAQWGSLEFLASRETSDAFEKNQIWIRAIQEIDIGLRHPESFCLVSDAATT